MKLFLLILISVACLYVGLNKETPQDRPDFEVVHSGISPVACDLVYRDKRKVVSPDDVLLHDYFKKSDGKYYFAVSVKERKFLLSASYVVKSKMSAKAVDTAFQFAKMCRAYGKPTIVSPKVDSNTLTPEEVAHIKNSVKRVDLKADVFKQNGRLLDISDVVRKKNRSDTYQKHLGTYYLIEGTIPKYYSSSTLTVWTSRSVSRNGGEAGYCLSYDLAYYHAICQYFEKVKKRNYAGAKPASSNSF